MSSRSFEEIIKFYENFENYKDESKWMAKFVKHLFTSRDLSSLHFFTSHQVLCFSMLEDYEDWSEKSIISIDLNWGASKEYRYKISLEQRKLEIDLLRHFTESVYCPFEKSLEIFDEMLEKLKNTSK